MQREGKIKLTIGISIVIIVIVIIASMIYFDNPIFNPKNPNNPSSNVIIPSGTQFDINYGGYHSVPFQTNETMTLSGSFTSTSPVIMYVVTNNEYQQFLAGTTLSGQSLPYNTGAVSASNLTFSLPPGDYYIVFMNANEYSGVTVYINADFTLSNYYVS